MLHSMRIAIFIAVLLQTAAVPASCWQSACVLQTATNGTLNGWNIGVGNKGTEPLWKIRPQKAWFYCSIKCGEADDFSISVNETVIYSGKISKPGQPETFCVPVDPAILKQDSWSFDINSPCKKEFAESDCVITDCGFAFESTEESGVQMYEGAVHLHTKYSDSIHSFDERENKAKSYGYVFMIVTDHADQIGQTVTQKINGAKVGVGYTNYLREGSDHTDKSFVTITGFEIETPWSDTAGKHSSHMLVFPWQSDKEDPNFQGVDNQPNQIQSVINLCSIGGLACTSNHPFSVQVGMNFLFDFAEYSSKLAKWPSIELMNNYKVDQYKDEVSKANEAVARHIKVGLYSGCDSHNAAYPTDISSWKHATLILAKELTLEGLVTAFKNCQTIALDEGTVVRIASLLPDGSTQVTDSPRFRYVFGFKKLMPKLLWGSSPFKLKVRVYRDGIVVPDSERSYDKDLKEISYDWSDSAAEPGIHHYIVEMERCFVTSPIEVLVAK